VQSPNIPSTAPDPSRCRSYLSLRFSAISVTSQCYFLSVMRKSSRKRRRSPTPSSISVSREEKNPILEVLQRLERRMDVLERDHKKRPRVLSESSQESSDSVGEEEPDVADCSDAEYIEGAIADLTQPGDLGSQASSSLHPEMLSIIGDEGGSS
ncbi:unnamed protein product, partial [Callosobruchus maculatus]